MCAAGSETDLIRQASWGHKKTSATDLARTEFPRATNEDLVPDPSCVLHDVRARRAPQKVVYLERVFSWFPLGDQVKKHPLRCAPHVWKVPKNEDPEHQDQQANSTTPHLSGHVSELGSWVGALVVFSVVEEGAQLTCVETRHERSQRLRRECKVGVAPAASEIVPYKWRGREALATESVRKPTNNTVVPKCELATEN